MVGVPLLQSVEGHVMSSLSNNMCMGGREDSLSTLQLENGARKKFTSWPRPPTEHKLSWGL